MDQKWYVLLLTTFLYGFVQLYDNSCLIQICKLNSFPKEINY